MPRQHVERYHPLNPRNAFAVVKQARAGYELGKKVHGTIKRWQSKSKSVSKRSKRGNSNRAGGVGSTMKNGIGAARGRARLRKSKKRGSMGLGTFKYIEIISGFMSSSAGLQGYGDMMAHGTRTQFLAAGQGGQTGYGISDVGYFEMNPNQRITGSQFLLAQLPGSERLFIKSINYCFKLSNNESIATDATLYFVTPKDDSLAVPTNAWADSLNSEALGQITTAPSAPGTYNQTLSAAGVPTRQIWGQSPFAQPSFRKQYKKLKAVKIKLAAGASEDYNFNVAVNRLVMRDKITENGNSVYLKNTTVQVFYVIHGQAVVDKTGGAHVAVLGSTEVSWVCRNTVTLGMMKSQVSNVDVQRAYVAPGVGATLANQYAINEVDVVAPVQQA